MTQIKQVYKCNICGNVVEVTSAGGGELVCCGQPMELLVEKTEDEGQEKHIPVIEKNENGVKVSVGSVVHPMEENHFIEWVELITENGNIRKFLKPTDAPEVIFEISGENLSARSYCNIHGLWTSV